MKRLFLFGLLIFFALFSGAVWAQISPGDLTDYHAHLEGMKNCTQCHVLGQKISNDKCLECHKELKTRIDQKKGYHSSTEVKGKNCSTCHNEHHGRTFKLIRFEAEKFNHNLAGYKLEGAHAKKTCRDCHKPEHIKVAELKKKKYTYLGLDTKCASCHVDYHQNTLSTSCEKCHNNTAFKPASLFNHSSAKFQLAGKHEDVTCGKCHKLEVRAGKKFQVFTGIKFDNCVRCHEDAHQNKFGQNCKQCHTESGFHTIKTSSGFDHDKTNFKLVGKHRDVKCNLCHKNKITDPVRHELCTDCHKDYHESQFSVNGKLCKCDECHTNESFVGSNFTIEKHNQKDFKLEGAHLATPCFSCHKKTEKWSFRQIGNYCLDCHENIHEPLVNKKDYQYFECKNCHATAKWPVITYDHAKTKFPLSGVHEKQTCRKCHITTSPEKKDVYRFAGLPVNCTQCHKDTHNSQFDVKGSTDCKTCHAFDKWKIDAFDHDKAAFKLDGKHKNIACIRCHSEVVAGTTKYILYKTNKLKCENCH